MNHIISILEDFSQKNHQPINKLIAQTILANSDINNFSNLNLTILAKQSYTSTASIIRFCKKLGFSGYSEFKFAFLRALQEKQESKNFQICFSCTNFWKEIETTFLFFNKTQELLIKKYVANNSPIYLLVPDSIKHNVALFLNKLQPMFLNIDLRVLSSIESSCLELTTKQLVFSLVTPLPSWFQHHNYDLIILVSDNNCNFNQEQLLFLLARFISQFS